MKKENTEQPVRDSLQSRMERPVPSGEESETQAKAPLSKAAMLREYAEKLFSESGLILEHMEPQNNITISFKKSKQ